jgi:hypothetical protein
MSTKTTFKRVALATVAAMGFGLLSVVPASAEAEATTELTTVAIAATGTGRVNSVFASSVTFALTAAVEADETITLRARFDAKPATSTAVIGFNTVGLDVGDLSVTEAATVSAANAAGNELLPAKTAITSDNTAATADAANTGGQVGFIPDVVGTYTVTVWHDANSNGLIDTTESFDSEDFVVGNAVSSVKVTSITGTTIEDGLNGAIVKLELLDAAGVAAGLASNEAIRLSPSTSTMDITLANGVAVAHTAGAGSFVDLVAANFTAGVSYVNLTDTAAATVTISIAGQGGSVTGVVGTFTQKFVTADFTGNTATTAMTTGATTAATYGVAGNNGVAGTLAATEIPVGSKTLTYLTTLTAGVTTLTTTAYLVAQITDNSGYTTGAAVQGITTDLVQDKALLLTESATTAGTFTTSHTVTTTAPTAALQATVVVVNGAGTNADYAAGLAAAVAAAAQNMTITSVVGALAAGSATVSPSSALSLKIGGAATYAVTVKDKFGKVSPNVNVTMVITGRNANQTVTPPSTTTGSTGIATFTLTDAPLAGTTALTDSIVFTAVGADAVARAATAVTITWSATGPVVGKVTILGGNNATTTGVADSTPTVIDIAAGNGAQAGATAFVATVTDATGNLLVGVPVTFTVSGTTAAVTSTTQTVYTGAVGTASGSVYAWVAGDYTVTATAGGVAGTAVLTAAQLTNTEARAISATVSGTIITAKVVDRFGNAVPSVTVYATKTGPGFFGAGVTSTSAVTNTAGIAEFVIAGGDAEVTVSTLDPNAAAGTKAFGQTCAAANFVGCLTTSTALTAATVGTTTTAEVGIGASIAAAGVSSAKVTVTGDSSAQAAADAAAEATDAANAATDAANAAAEAADAATAAAQDAADAVAALSTQVSEMVNALKKQITALTNLVIKIQKKVKA